jgi:hypothetical protein
MERALFLYTFLNLAILGAVLWFVRASRLRRARPDERQDLEENALVRADWELVRIEHCIPSGCPRVIGQPPRPRRDVTCEVCATTFLEQRLQRLLSSPPGSNPTPPDPPWIRDALSGRVGGSRSAPMRGQRSARGDLASSLIEADPGGERRGRTAAVAAQLGVVRVGIGLACVAVGAGVAAFGGLLWLIVPGALLVLIGLGLIAAGVTQGAE